jgi:dipeptidyl aminopeptidase/acylaminoacyl peptidase
MTDSSASSSSLIWPILITGTKILGVLILAIAGAIYLNQDRLLYMPNPPGFPKTPDENPPGFTAPSEWTKDGRLFQRLRNKDETQKIPFEDVIITTDDGAALHAWLMLQDGNEAHRHPTLIYFHGNAGNMGFRMKNAVDMYSKVKINILMMDYRGYGKRYRSSLP